MVDFLNWWVETWPRSIVGVTFLCGLLFGAFVAAYDIGINLARRKK